MQNNTLTHHGIKGQKWGVRRYQNEDGTLTAAGKKRASETENSEEKDSSSKKKKGLSTKQKVAIGVTALVAAYATYKFVDSGGFARMKAKGEAFVKGGTPIWDKDMKLADPNMSEDDIFSKIVAQINPDYYNVDNRRGSVKNCRRCTYSYELARRGFRVQATKTRNGTGQHDFGVYNATHDDQVNNIFSIMSRTYKSIRNGEGDPFDIPKIETDYTERSKTVKAIMDELGRQPDRARGELSWGWKSGSGHSVAWEIINGKPVIFDTQIRKKISDSSEFIKYLGSEDIGTAQVIRLDDKYLNYDFLLKWVKKNSWMSSNSISNF